MHLVRAQYRSAKAAECLKSTSGFNQDGVVRLNWNFNLNFKSLTDRQTHKRTDKKRRVFRNLFVLAYAGRKSCLWSP